MKQAGVVDGDADGLAAGQFGARLDGRLDRLQDSGVEFGLLLGDAVDGALGDLLPGVLRVHRGDAVVRLLAEVLPRGAGGALPGVDAMCSSLGQSTTGRQVCRYGVGDGLRRARHPGLSR